MTWSSASVVGVLSLVLAVAALVLAVCLGLRTRAWDPTVPVVVDLLLSAALLRLTATDDSWRSIIAVAALVAVRTLWTLGTGARRGGVGRPRRHAG